MNNESNDTTGETPHIPHTVFTPLSELVGIGRTFASRERNGKPQHFVFQKYSPAAWYNEEHLTFASDATADQILSASTALERHVEELHFDLDRLKATALVSEHLTDQTRNLYTQALSTLDTHFVNLVKSLRDTNFDLHHAHTKEVNQQRNAQDPESTPPPHRSKTNPDHGRSR